MIKITLKVEKYNSSSKLATNGNDPKLRHMSKSVGCEVCGGPKSYKAQLCQRCARDYADCGPVVFSSSWYNHREYRKRGG